MPNKYSTIIIDDEPLARERLQKLLSNFTDVITVVGEAKNGNDGLEKIQNLNPNLLFLDIEMPGLTGFELLEKLVDIPLIVFCTAHDEYSLKAFETNSIDYLVKPVRLERLEKTIKKLQQFNTVQNTENILEVIKNLGKQSNKKMTSITVKNGDSLSFIKLEDVVYFEASDKYVNIMTNKNVQITEKSLTQLESQLPDNFLRVHRGFIININFVAEVSKCFNSRYIIKMSDKKRSQITSGRSYLAQIKAWLG